MDLFASSQDDEYSPDTIAMKDAMYIPLNERKISRLEDELKDSSGSKSSRNETKLLSDQMSASIGSKNKKRGDKILH